MEKDLNSVGMTMGFSYNPQTETLAGNDKGYSVAVKENPDGTCYGVYCWVKGGDFTQPDALEKFMNERKDAAESPLKAWRYDGNTLVSIISKTSGQNSTNLKEHIEAMTMFFSMNYYENCCAMCGSEDGLAIEDKNGSVFQLCAKCRHKYEVQNGETQTAEQNVQAVQNDMQTAQAVQNDTQQPTGYGVGIDRDVPQNNAASYNFGYDQNSSGNIIYHPVAEKNNVFLGFLGAVLFSLAGVVIWVFISQLGYISYLGGLVLAFAAVFGYKKFSGGGFNAVSIMVCVVVIAGMLLFAETSSTVLYIMRNINDTYGVGISFIDSWGWLPSFLEDSEVSSSFIQNLVFGYIITGVASVIIFVAEMKQKK